ncbi:hypothetical protein [Flammeovirga aprica]|uniref:Uncharacterized protein n=1 Tax=Flammeovirga aprica JL-4 TaxID=694437 RepID=A0A7X9S0R2_9BACT|nr:hypothetical protein [Flammeovirga aprica]NME72288.1 hypothetical protein [Flammeovirga aprica JL-4]
MASSIGLMVKNSTLLELSPNLIYLSVLMLSVYSVLFLLSIFKGQNKLYISADAVLLIIPCVLLFSFAEELNKKNKPKTDYVKLMNLSNGAYVNLDLYFEGKRNPNFKAFHEELLKVEQELMQFGTGNDIKVSNRFLFERNNYQRIEKMAQKFFLSLNGNKEHEKMFSLIYEGHFDKEIVKNNSVVELNYRLKILSIQLKNLEMQIYADSQN